MARLRSNLTLLLLQTLAVTSCNGQDTTDAPQAPQTYHTIVKKHHFISGLPEEYYFVQCGLEDRQGNMWFGTAGNGIYVYNEIGFINFTHKSYGHFVQKEDLNHNDVLCCLEDNAGNIWFGTRRGLIRYQPGINMAEGKDFDLFLIPENTITSSTRTRVPYQFQFGDNFVWSMMQDKTGKIWFGTSKGLYVHNPVTDNINGMPLFTRFLDNDSLVNQQHLQLLDVSAMLQDKNGTIWFVSAWTKSEGIVRYDGTSLTSFTPDSIHTFRTMLESKNGDLLFLSSFKGVYAYDGRGFSNLNEKIGLKNDTLVSMLEDRSGNLWLGHSSGNMQNGGDGGVYRYDGKSLKLLTTKDGLSHNHVFCMIPDSHGNIWFGTRNTGLCRYDGKTWKDFTE